MRLIYKIISNSQVRPKPKDSDLSTSESFITFESKAHQTLWMNLQLVLANFHIKAPLPRSVVYDIHKCQTSLEGKELETLFSMISDDPEVSRGVLFNGLAVIAGFVCSLHDFHESTVSQDPNDVKSAVLVREAEDWLAEFIEFSLAKYDKFLSQRKSLILRVSQNIFNHRDLFVAIRILKKLVRRFEKAEMLQKEVGALLGWCYAELREHRNALAAFKKTGDKGLYSSVYASYSGFLDLTPSKALKIRKRFVQVKISTLPAPSKKQFPEKLPISGKKLTIGYISSDFRLHPVSQFIRPILKNHSSKVDIVCFSTVADESVSIQSEISQYPGLKFIALHNMLFSRAMRCISEECVDILIDLSGWMCGGEVPPYQLIYQRLAPIQGQYLGFPMSMAMEGYDFRITSHLADKPKYQKYYTERLEFLPDTMHAFQPLFPVTDPDTLDQAPVAKNGSYTFACIQRVEKYSEPCLKAWVKILKSMPNSKLILKDRNYSKKEVITGVRYRLEKLGAPMGQVEFKDHFDDYQAYMNFLSTVDIVFDTWPYNGTTTTADAYWMGAPTMTMYQGSRHLSRVGKQFCDGLKAPQYAVKGWRAFAKRVLKIAKDKDGFIRFRKGLAKTFRSSIFCDGKRLANQMETLFFRLMKRYNESVKKG